VGKKARLIYNPTAGREVVERHLDKILARLEEAGYETSYVATQALCHATEEAKQAADREFDVVIAAGGDGTLHEVINGLLRHPSPPKLGILPAGTSNDFAHALKIPRDLIAACQVIVDGQTTRVDVGKWNQRYFINAAAAGRLSEITFEAPSKLKTVMGPLAYYLKALKQLGTLHKTFSLTLKTAERSWKEELLLLIIANSVHVAGFEKLAPEASLSDGRFDVLLIRKGHIPDLLQIAALALRGRHIHDERVEYFQTSQLEVETDQELKLNLDGEWGGECKGVFSVIPQGLEVFCPVEKERS
jgi:diacylglycerol kinase (ATP)